MLWLLSEMRRILLFCLSIMLSLGAFAEEKKYTRQEYIASWKDEAIYQMAVHHIPASITMAQGILESGDGNSRLAREGNNHFGIKCHQDWSGERIYEDDETKGECFRSYNHARESYEDHSAFLQRKRYESLFKLDADDYKAWARGLKECGYATNPNYPQLLIKIIEEFNLAEFDKTGLNHIKKKSTPHRPNDPAIPANVGTDVAAHDNKKHDKKSGKKQGTQEERTSITLSSGREIKISDNGIKFVATKAGETPQSIADDLDMHVMFITKYNDFSGSETFKSGDRVYLQPKRGHGSASEHTVKSGELLRDISQKYGIKLKKLRKYNQLEEGKEPKSGQILKLKR
jgi:LysM repeat protein